MAQQGDEDVISANPGVTLGHNLNAHEPVSDPSSSRPLSSDSIRTEKHLTNPKPNSQPEPILPALRYRRTTICLLVFYIPLLVIPWVLTCVLAVRPLNARSYINQGLGISPNEIINIGSWLAVVQVLNSIRGVVTIPIVSTLLAQAAVVYSQRRKAKQSLSIRQTFALADRGWSDITILWGSFGSNEAGTSSRFLWFAAILIITCKFSCNRSRLWLTHSQVP